MQITQTGKQLRRMKPALQRKVASSLASSVFACISLAFHQVPNTIVTFFPARWKNFTIVRAGLTHTRSRDRRRGERVRSTPARGETAVRGLSSRYPRARRRGVSVRGGDRPAGPWRAGRLAARWTGGSKGTRQARQARPRHFDITSTGAPRQPPRQRLVPRRSLDTSTAVELDTFTPKHIGSRGFLSRSVEVCRVCRGLSRSVEVCRVAVEYSWSSSCRVAVESILSSRAVEYPVGAFAVRCGESCRRARAARYTVLTRCTRALRKSHANRAGPGARRGAGAPSRVFETTRL